MPDLPGPSGLPSLPSLPGMPGLPGINVPSFNNPFSMPEISIPSLFGELVCESLTDVFGVVLSIALAIGEVRPMTLIRAPGDERLFSSPG